MIKNPVFCIVTMSGNCFIETDAERAKRFADDPFYLVLVCHKEYVPEALNADGSTSKISTYTHMVGAGDATDG